MEREPLDTDTLFGDGEPATALSLPTSHATATNPCGLLALNGEVLTASFSLKRREITALSRLPGFADLLALLSQTRIKALDLSITADAAPTTRKLKRIRRTAARQIGARITLSAIVEVP